LWGKSLIVALYCNATVYTILFDAAAKQLQLRNHCFRKNSVSFEMKSQENFQVVQYCSLAVSSAWPSLLVTSSKSHYFWVGCYFFGGSLLLGFTGKINIRQPLFSSCSACSGVEFLWKENKLQNYAPQKVIRYWGYKEQWQVIKIDSQWTTTVGHTCYHVSWIFGRYLLG